MISTQKKTKAKIYNTKIIMISRARRAYEISENKNDF